jgi:hypothetical protein
MSERGPVLLAARTRPARSLPAGLAELRRAVREEPWRLRLYFARPLGRWHPFADLTLSDAEDQDDAELRFDAVRRPLPGAGTYGWARLVREPSYRRVQDPRR